MTTIYLNNLPKRVESLLHVHKDNPMYEVINRAVQLTWVCTKDSIPLVRELRCINLIRQWESEHCVSNTEPSKNNSITLVGK